MTGHSERASRALSALVEADPAIAALSLWCEHRDGEETRSSASSITYGAEFSDLAGHEQIGLAAHHILHVALRHPARLGELQSRLGAGFDPALYNLAADAVVNEALLIGGHALPRPAVTLTGLLSEALNISITAEVALTEWDVERLYAALTGPANGSGEAPGRVQAYAKQRSFAPDLDPSPGGAEAAGDVEQAARWAQHFTRAMEAGRQAGRGIGRIGHQLADIAEPRTPWEIILRRLLARALMIEPQPNPHRPARRWIAGVAEAQRRLTPMPGFEQGQRLLGDAPRLVVGIDASGSIDDGRLALFWGEVTGIARRMRAELHLLVFDDGVRHRERIDPAQTRLSLPELPRGGGTDFQPVIGEALALHASALVLLTDLDGPTGPAPKGLPVIWAVPEARGVEAPFGQLVDLTW